MTRFCPPPTLTVATGDHQGCSGPIMKRYFVLTWFWKCVCACMNAHQCCWWPVLFHSTAPTAATALNRSFPHWVRWDLTTRGIIGAREMCCESVFSSLTVGRLQTGEANGFGLKPISDREAGKHTNGHLPQVGIVCMLKATVCNEQQIA